MQYAYITGDATMAALAEKHGCSLGAVRKRANREAWRKARLEYREGVFRQAVAQAGKQDLQQLSGLVTAVEQLVKVTTKTLADEKQFFRYVVKEVDAEKQSIVSEKVFHKMDTRALGNVTAALRALTGLLREFYDMPTPLQTHARHIAEEKLELDRAKLQTGQTTNEELGVILLPPVKEEQT